MRRLLVAPSLAQHGCPLWLEHQHHHQARTSLVCQRLLYPAAAAAAAAASVYLQAAESLEALLRVLADQCRALEAHRFGKLAGYNCRTPLLSHHCCFLGHCWELHQAVHRLPGSQVPGSCWQWLCCSCCRARQSRRRERGGQRGSAGRGSSPVAPALRVWAGAPGHRVHPVSLPLRMYTLPGTCLCVYMDARMLRDLQSDAPRAHTCQEYLPQMAAQKNVESHMPGRSEVRCTV